jgi:hypothetical protein
MRSRIWLVCLGLLICGCAHNAARSGRGERKTKDFIVQHLQEEGVTEGTDTVLYERVADRIQGMPYLAQSSERENIRVIRVLCEPFAFAPRPAPTP